MRTLNTLLVIGLVIFALGFIFAMKSAGAATLTGQNFPYWIFSDNGVERWCEDPPAGATTAICWSAGESKECKMLRPENGYIDCSINKGEDYE